MHAPVVRPASLLSNAPDSQCVPTPLLRSKPLRTWRRPALETWHESAVEAFQTAGLAARSSGHGVIGVHHLAAGLSDALRVAGLNGLSDRAAHSHPRMWATAPGCEAYEQNRGLEWDSTVKRLSLAAAREARLLGNRQISAQHVALALLKMHPELMVDSDAAAAELMSKLTDAARDTLSEVRLSSHAFQSLMEANAFCAAAGNTTITTLHLLVGLAQAEGGAASLCLAGHGVEATALLHAVETIMGCPGATCASKDAGRGEHSDEPLIWSTNFSTQVLMLLRSASNRAHTRGDNFITTADILHEMLVTQDTTQWAAKALAALSADVSNILSDVRSEPAEAETELALQTYVQKEYHTAVTRLLNPNMLALAH